MLLFLLYLLILDSPIQVKNFVYHNLDYYKYIQSQIHIFQINLLFLNVLNHMFLLLFFHYLTFLVLNWFYINKKCSLNVYDEHDILVFVILWVFPKLFIFTIGNGS